MALPTCECIKGLPQADKLDAIYCALLAISQGGGGGDITLSQITDLAPFWEGTLQGTPPPDSIFTTNDIGAVDWLPFTSLTITASQISDSTEAGRNLLMLATPVEESAITIRPDAGINTKAPTFFMEWAAGGGGPTLFTGTVGPVNVITGINGVITAAS